jgi:hypothetical protein
VVGSKTEVEKGGERGAREQRGGKGRSDVGLKACQWGQKTERRKKEREATDGGVG